MDLPDAFTQRYGPLNSASHVVFRCDGGWRRDGGRWSSVAVQHRNGAAVTSWYYRGQNVLETRDYGHWNDACAEGMSLIAALNVLLYSTDVDEEEKDGGIVFYIDREPLVTDLVSQRVFSKPSKMLLMNALTVSVAQGFREECNWEYLLVLKQIADRVCEILLGTDRILCIATRQNDNQYLADGSWLPDQMCKKLLQEPAPAPMSPLPFKVHLSSFDDLRMQSDDWDRIAVQKKVEIPQDGPRTCKCPKVSWYFADRKALDA